MCVCAPRCFLISCFSFEILHVRSFIKQCGTKNSWSEGGSTETCWKWELEKKGGREPSERFFSGDEFMHLKIRKAEIDACSQHRRESHHHCGRDIHHSGINVRPFLCRRRPFCPFLVPVWWAKCTRQCCWDCPIKAMAYTVPHSSSVYMYIFRKGRRAATYLNVCVHHDKQGPYKVSWVYQSQKWTFDRLSRSTSQWDPMHKLLLAALPLSR